MREEVSIDTENQNLIFFTNNELEKYRALSIFEKEPETIMWIEKCIKSFGDPGAVFFDIGANIGVYSIYAGSMSRKAQIYSFEPSFSNYESLIANINGNALENIMPNHMAVSNSTGITDLFLSDLRYGNSGAQILEPVDENGESFEPKKVEKILRINFQELVTSYGFPVPNFVKLDVDGHEEKILDAMQPSFADNRFKSVLVEFNDPNSLSFWEERLKQYGLNRDRYYENLSNHSSKRRLKSGNKMRNIIFSKGIC